MDNLVIKPATKNDSALLLSLIHELAAFENASERVEVTTDKLEACLFSARPYAYAVLAYLNDSPIGYALYFYNYSSYIGKAGIYLEDIYIKPEQRGRNLGKKIMAYLAQHAKERDCAFISWNVLDWNTHAMEFYHSIGGKPAGCMPFKISGEQLTKLAEYANSPSL